MLWGVIAGRHQVEVFKDDPFNPIDYSSSPQLVAVNSNDTSEVAFALTKSAPNFTLKSLVDEDITLQEYRGKVVLLIFFSHT